MSKDLKLFEEKIKEAKERLRVVDDILEHVISQLKELQGQIVGSIVTDADIAIYKKFKETVSLLEKIA